MLARGLFHNVIDTRNKFIANYLCAPTPWAYSKVFLPCLNLHATLTLSFFTFLMIPQLFVINHRFQSANIINSKRILLLCEFLSNAVKPHFAVFFLQ